MKKDLMIIQLVLIQQTAKDRMNEWVVEAFGLKKITQKAFLLTQGYEIILGEKWKAFMRRLSERG
jgi:hypothetical protein